MSPRRTAPGASRWLEWGTATDEPRSRVLDHQGAMLFTGSTVRRAGDDAADPPGRVVELIEPARVVVAWACGAIGATDPAGLRAVARPRGVRG